MLIFVVFALNSCLHRLIQVLDEKRLSTASWGWAVCWCQRCGSSGPWWRWGYGMGHEHRCILLMQFWMHSDTVTRDSEAHCCAIHPWPSPEGAEWWCMTTCCKDLYRASGSRKYPSSCMTSRLTREVTYNAIEILWTVESCDPQGRCFKYIPNNECLSYLSLCMFHLQNWSIKVTTAS